MPTLSEKDYLIGLTHFLPFGPKRLAMLKNFFKFWSVVWTAPAGQLAKAGLGEKIASDFVTWRDKINPEKILANLAKENIKTISLEEENYPQRLKPTFDPPFILFYQGELKEDEKPLAVVGSRKCTPYGAKIIDQTIPPLIFAGVTIVSGLALGIDALAHIATLKSGGRTIGILGCGLDERSFYPTQNRFLRRQIIEQGGLVMSEFPPGTQPLKPNFPRRNRIIAGLSLGTFVVEAGIKSGSLITSRFALEEGRDVYAAPGSIFSFESEGPNQLIKQGARPILAASDLLEGLGLETEADNKENIKRDWSGMSEEERSILLNLSSEPTNINDLKRGLQLDISLINSTLTILEIKGIVKTVGGGNYILL